MALPAQLAPLSLWWGPLWQLLQPTSMALREPLVMLALVLMPLEQ